MIKLTQRETDVVSSYVRLGRWKAVAEELNLAVGTVKTHQCAAMRKLEAANSAQLVRVAIARGIVHVGEGKP